MAHGDMKLLARSSERRVWLDASGELACPANRGADTIRLDLAECKPMRRMETKGVCKSNAIDKGCALTVFAVQDCR